MPAFFLTDDKASQEEFLACIRDTAKAIAESCAQPAPDSGTGGQAFFPAYCGPEPAELRAQLAAIPVFPAEGKGFQAVLENIRTHVLPNLVRTASPGYLAHLHSPVLLESVAAELVIAAFNPSMDSWDQSPAATESAIPFSSKSPTQPLKAAHKVRLPVQQTRSLAEVSKEYTE